jgi:hypothetical protein
LQQVEVRPTIFVKANQFPIDDSPRWQPGQRLNDIGKFLIQGLLPAREKGYATSVHHSQRPVSIELDFFCGDERYVALTLIGDLAKRNFAEKHHII